MYNKKLKWGFTDKEIEDLADQIIDNNITLRQLESITNIPKSTLHRILHKRLPNINSEKYEKFKELLNKNYSQKHIKGGESTKKKFDDLNN